MGQGKAFGIEHGVVGHLVLLHLIFFLFVFGRSCLFGGQHFFCSYDIDFYLLTMVSK